jgi:hypothetical protein
MAVSVTQCDKLGKDVSAVLEFQSSHCARAARHMCQMAGLLDTGHDKLAAPRRRINQYNVLKREPLRRPPEASQP